MKTLSGLIVAASILFTASSGYAETPHGHEHAFVGGPKGGRFLEHTEPRAEFFVEKDLSVTVAFYDQELKPAAATEQSVFVIAETGGKKTTLDFEKKGDVLVSKGTLPQEPALNLVVRFKQAPADKTRNFRFVYEDHICGDCQRAEYACTCGHGA
ncbi:MAG: hypothetical protein KBC91_08570 [Candidatus Omnitrophica bacterium]|nr:hypothetical protein [Candidatus Omnitrophota bacterium]